MKIPQSQGEQLLYYCDKKLGMNGNSMDDI
jgi:hypothetical protein